VRIIDSDTARPRHRDCLNHHVTDNETIDHSGSRRRGFARPY
jgi:hypothetical protein